MNLQNTQLIIYLTTPPNMADLQQRTKSKKRSIEVRTFIETVRKFPCLYNKNAKGYKDAMMKSALWNKIGEKMQMSGDEAEKKWKIQRDRYNKERKKAKESLSDGGPCYTPTWFLYDLMDVILSSPNQEETSLIPVKEEVDPDTLMATGHLPMANNLEICEADEIPTEILAKKPKNLTLMEKVNVIKMINENKMSIKEAVVRFKCGKTQIYNIMKQKDKIMELYVSGMNRDLTRVKTREAKYSELDRIVYKWFTAMRARNFTLSGPILQEKAKEIAKNLKLESFSGSNGWLQSFRKRHNIIFKGLGSEAYDIDKKEIDHWNSRLKKIIHNYNPTNIANMDETALFYRVLPNKAFQIKGEKCSRGQHSAERLTVLFIAYADGKLENPIIVGKNETPHCFRNLKKHQLPLEWKANNKAWMTSTIFEEFLNKLNNRMVKENRNILVFIGNATCHPRIHLSNVQLVFLPPCLSSLQPLDNGIFQNVKLNYRKLMLQHVIANRSNVNIDVLDAIMFLNHSVKSVKEEDIKRCFRNCGFTFDNIGCKEIICHNDYSEIQTLIEEIYGDRFGIIDAESYINLDQNVTTENFGIHSVFESQNSDNGRSSDDEETYDDEELDMLSPSDVSVYISALKHYAKMKGMNDFYEKVIDLELSFNQSVAKETKQLRLDNFIKL